MLKTIRRFELTPLKVNPLFIGAWAIEDISTCDKIVSAFDKDIATNAKVLTCDDEDNGISNKTRISLSSGEIECLELETVKDYRDFLKCCYKDYTYEWPFLQSMANSIQMSSFEVTKYSKGQHLERVNMCRSLTSLDQFFVYTTFLNDCKGQSSIHFRHYDLEIQSQKGLTLIWPADWIHAHTLNTANAEEMCILTGWLEAA